MSASRLTGLCLLASFMLGCDSRTTSRAPEPSEASYSYEFSDRPETRVRVVVAARIEHRVLDDSLEVELTAEPGDEVQTEVHYPRMEVLGRVLDFSGQELLLDDENLGPLERPATIEVKPDGILVNGDKRASW